VSRREDARECFADECVESLCASLRSRRYSRSPVMLNGVGVVRVASGGSGTNSTQDSAQIEKKLLFSVECLFNSMSFYNSSGNSRSSHFSVSFDNNTMFPHARKILSPRNDKKRMNNN